MAGNETNRLGMPLLQAAQAQKHVTVNEAMMRLDGLVGLVLQSITAIQPPAVVVDGQCWAVATGATGAWLGYAGQIAIAANGGWLFQTPSIGLRAFVVDRRMQATYDGSRWISGAITIGQTGGGILAGLAESEVTVTSGASFTTDIVIPAGSLVIGATARVSVALTGTLLTWQLGTSGALNRFGQGLGKAAGSWARGLLGQPMSYFQAANLIMTAEGGTFTGGRVKIAVHWLSLRIPD